jgi:hypothetical protein
MHVHEQIDFALELDKGNSKLRWLGLTFEDNFYKLFFLSVQFIIWRCKLNKTVPGADYCTGEGFYFFDKCISHRKKLCDDFEMTNSLLFRLWRTLRKPRW